MSVVDYASEQEIARIPVGDHPQRMRMGLVRSDAIGGLPPSPGGRRRARGASRRSCGSPARGSRGGRLDLRLGMTSRATGRVRAVYGSSGRRSRFWIRIPKRTGRAEAVDRHAAGSRAGSAARRRASSRSPTPAARACGRTGCARGSPTRRARLRRTLTAIDQQGRLVARGTVVRGAPGVVRLRFDAADESSVLHFHAPIVRGALVAARAAAVEGRGRRRAALDPVHGRARAAGIRGESLSKAVAR